MSQVAIVGEAAAAMTVDAAGTEMTTGAAEEDGRGRAALTEMTVAAEKAEDWVADWAVVAEVARLLKALEVTAIALEVCVAMHHPVCLLLVVDWEPELVQVLLLGAVCRA